jgi:hypothetical protein
MPRAAKAFFFTEKANLPFISNETYSALHLGRLNSTLSIGSNDTINFEIDASLWQKANKEKEHNELKNILGEMRNA